MDTVRLKSTWAAVAAHGDNVPSIFYAHLFVTHPELREMFPLSMSNQRDKLVGALGRIVSSVDELGGVVGFIEQLGRDHRRFTVAPEHYDAVGASLLWTLKHFLGDRWTPEVAQDWTDAYGVIASTMVGAAEAAQDSQPAWWDASVTHVTRASREVALVRVKLAQPLDFRPGQSMAVSIPQAPRVWRYFTPANAPRPDDTLDLHVAMVPGGMISRPFVSQIAVGDVIRVGAPVGTNLAVEPDAAEDLLMVGGSTGIAPFLAILDDIEQAWLEGRTTRRVHLVHGVRYPWSRYATRLLERLAEHPRFTYTEAVSEDPTFPGASGLAGDVAATTSMPGPYDALVAGSPGMVAHTISRLTARADPPRRIAYEEFDLTTDPSAGTAATDTAPLGAES